ncbi:hypothetical protein [Tahibacter harae]|uniref:DRBM domain-containing protein n=1 Tax=Tahibacter harae TaxID=2963937 RepID=A0ABT1QQZ3_9GAMM|nr:hypothetical protein [Tahibacter harae]MCQ4164694.1 hypothetical protein [Tahibacter harae]
MAHEQLEQAITGALQEALRAIPGRKMTPVEWAMNTEPKNEVLHCNFRAGRVLPRVTGKAQRHAIAASRLLAEAQRIILSEI